MTKEFLNFQPLEAITFQAANQAKDLALREIKRLTDEADELQKKVDAFRKEAKALQDQNSEIYNEAIRLIFKANDKTLPANKQISVICDEKNRPVKLEWDT